jgi:hypothetical protein
VDWHLCFGVLDFFCNVVLPSRVVRMLRCHHTFDERCMKDLLAILRKIVSQWYNV